MFVTARKGYEIDLRSYVQSMEVKDHILSLFSVSPI